MPILTFITNTAGKLTYVPFLFFVCDLIVTTFLNTAFGTTSGFFRLRFRRRSSPKSTGPSKGYSPFLK